MENVKLKNGKWKIGERENGKSINENNGKLERFKFGKIKKWRTLKSKFATFRLQMVKGKKGKMEKWQGNPVVVLKCRFTSNE